MRHISHQNLRNKSANDMEGKKQTKTKKYNNNKKEK